MRRSKGKWSVFYTLRDEDGYSLFVNVQNGTALDVLLHSPDGEFKRVLVAARDGEGRVWTIKGGFIDHPDK